MKKLTLLSIALLPFLGVTQSLGGLLDNSSRAGKWEGYATGQVVVGPFYSAATAGVGLGYNIYDQLNVNGDLQGGEADALFYGSEPVVVGHLGIDYNIFKTKLTPFVTVGAGLGDVFNSGAWYYLDAGLGLRWDINDRWFTKLAVQPALLMHSGSKGALGAAMGGLCIGVKF